MFLCVYVCFQADLSEGLIHAVLGGPEPDVDTVAATLCLALHLSQVTLSLRICALSLELMLFFVVVVFVVEVFKSLKVK